MTRVKAVLLDLDGTLLDTLPDLLHAMNEALRAESLPAIARRELLPAVSAGTRAMLARAAPAAGEETLERLRTRFLDAYARDIGQHTAHFEGMPELLAWMDRRALAFGVVTNKLARYSGPLLQRFGLDARAACLVCADGVAAPKPSPAPLLEAASQLGFPASDLVYVGDAPGDVRAANAAGMPALVAGWGYVAPGDDPARWGRCNVMTVPGDVGTWLEPDSASPGAAG